MSNILADIAFLGFAGAMALSNPLHPDAAAMFGSAAAMVYTFHETKSSGKVKGLVLLSVFGSFFFGVCLPGLLIYNILPWVGQYLSFLSYDFSTNMTWHAWAFLGFAFGIIGLAIPPLCEAVRDWWIRNRKKAADKAGRGLLGRTQDEDL